MSLSRLEENQHLRIAVRRLAEVSRRPLSIELRSLKKKSLLVRT